MRQWWTQHTGKLADDRPFGQLPPAVVLLEFYRVEAVKLLTLEARLKEKGHRLRLPFEEREELRRLTALLREPEAPSFSVAALLHSEHAVVISDDPIWERYVGYARAKTAEAIPASWFGKGKRGEEMKAKVVAKERAKRVG